MTTAREQGERDIAFGRWRLQPARRRLLRDGEPVALGSRAFDVLLALAEARGALVTKDALLARVWPGVVVEENNLQVQVSALRRALGEDAAALIATVPGKGYCLTAPSEVPSRRRSHRCRCRPRAGRWWSCSPSRASPRTGARTTSPPA